MKKILYSLVALATMTATLTSCENDAPEINFTQTDNHISDFSGIIKAINDQTKSLAEKLALIEEAIKNQTLTLSQKIDILNAAVENGVLTLKEMTEKLIKAIDDQTAGISEKLALIEEAIGNQTLTLGQKIDILNAAVENGVLTIEEMMEKIVKAINDQTTSLDAKLALIEEAMKNQTLSLENKFALLNECIKQGFLDEQTALKEMETSIASYLEQLKATVADGNDRIEKALEALKANNGVYRDPNDAYSIYLNPDVWEVVKSDTQLSKALQSTLSETVPSVTTSQQSAHTCVINITRQSVSAPELVESWEKSSVVAGENQELVRIVSISKTATYNIDKGSCALGIYEVFVTDAKGNQYQYTNLNGAGTGDVSLVFYHNGKIATSGHVLAIMR